MNSYNKEAFKGVDSLPENEIEKVKLFYWSEFNCGWVEQVSTKTKKQQLISVFNFLSDTYNVPDRGFFHMLGSFDCEILSIWCDLFGSKRVIGYDIVNPNNHPNVRIQDIRTLSVESIASAFVWNDCGYWFLTPQANLAGLKFAIKNVIIGGFYLSLFDRLSKLDLSLILKEHGFSLIFEHDSLTLYQKLK